MSRKVYVTSDMGKDDALLAVYDECPQAALLWPWFITAFDDWGRCHANARILRREVFPLFDHITAEDVDATLALYAAHGLVTLYQVGGKPYVCIRPAKWWRYQTHIHEEKRKLADDPIKGSHYPAPPSDAAREGAHIKEASAETRGDARVSAERSASFPPSPPPSFPPSHPSPPPSHPPGRAPDAHAPDASPDEVTWQAALFEAFDLSGLPRASLAGQEGRYAKALCTRYPPAQVVTCWQEIAAGEYGSDYEQRNLSFTLLGSKQFFGNWLMAKNGQMRPPAARRGRASERLNVVKELHNARNGRAPGDRAGDAGNAERPLDRMGAVEAHLRLLPGDGGG